MIAVGIDVSKSKSTVAILNGDGSIRAKPFDVHHVTFILCYTVLYNFLPLYLPLSEFINTDGTI